MRGKAFVALSVIGLFAVPLTVYAQNEALDITGSSPLPASSVLHECDDASTTVAIEGCNNGKLEKAEKLLNDKYRTLISNYQKTLEDAKKTDDREIFHGIHNWELISGIQGGLDELKHVERLWVQYRAANCNYYADGYKGGTFVPIAYSNCMLRMTQERAKELEDLSNP